MAKIAMQQLADSLGLSRVTVWKVLNDRPGVAPETVRRVQEAVRALDQPAPQNIMTPESPPVLRNITLLAARAGTSTFWIQIVDQIASELNQLHIRLNYLPIDIMQLDAASIIAAIQPEKTDGLIVLNVYEEAVIASLQSLPVPKVFFDTIPGHSTGDLRGDLILLEGRTVTSSITKELAKKGCRRIGFIGDVQYAYTNLLRWDGFLDAMKCCGIPVEPALCLTRPIDKDSYRNSISSFLDGIPSMPDAFVCASDFVAFVTLNLLEERGIRVPADLLLTGYDDAREFLLDRRGITTAHVQTTLLGRRLVRQLLYRMENPDADFEEIQIVPKILYRE